MLSVVIPTYNHERALVPTLAMLVPGAVAGAVREVIIADAGSTDATHAVADEAGCDVVTSSAPLASLLRSAVAKTRSSWLMFLKPGTTLDPTWISEATRFVDEIIHRGTVDAQAAVFRRGISAGDRRPAVVQAFDLAKAVLARTPSPEQGLLIAKRRYDDLGGHRDAAPNPESDLIARLGRRQIVTLRSAAFALGRYT